jgi:flagellar motor component MotA
MTRDEFIEKYYESARHILAFCEKARREGLLALEDALDQEKIASRDIFEYGMRFVIDGTPPEIIEAVLSNLLAREKDETMHTLKSIQKDAVLMMQEGMNPRILYAVLNSYTDIPLNEDKIIKDWE